MVEQSPSDEETEPGFEQALEGLRLPSDGATDAARERLAALIRGDAALQRGGLLGRYVVLEELGRGGMGVVYAAYDPQLDRRVALKVLLHRARGQQRLLDEARALARLRHPNVVTIHDVGEHDGAPFLAMEFIEGSTLRAWSEAGERGWSEVVEVMAAAGRGLAAADAAGIVHRDFKPLNVMLEPDTNGAPRVVVMDFGLAERGGSVSGETGDSSPPIDGQATPARPLAGTPAYMSREQFHEQTLGPASDQFSYCVTFYEALFGVRPFEGRGFFELMENVSAGRIRAAPNEGKVPRWLIEILHRGLRPDPNERHPSMEALLRALDHGAGRRRRLVLGIGGAAALGLVAIYGLSDRETACDREVAALQREWTPERAAALSVAFEASGHPNASRLWPRSHEAMETFVGDWSAEYQHVCGRWDGSLPAALVEARRACLLTERDHFLGLLEAFAEPTPATVGVALAATRGLPVPSACAEIDSLDAVPAEGWTQEILDAQSKLARAHARDSAGDGFGARALLAEAKVALANLDAWHTRAEIRKMEAVLDFREGDFEAGQVAIEHSQHLAAKSGDAGIVAETWVARVRLTRAHRPDDPGLPHLVEPAALAVEFAGHPPALDADLLLARGMGALDEGEFEAALGLFEEGIIIAANGGVDPLTTANLHDNRGRAENLLGDHERSKASSLRALEIVVEAWGPMHPAAGLFHQNVAAMCMILHDLGCARTHVEAASQILDASGDHTSMRRAANLGFWAQLDLAAEDPESARTHAEAALSILEGLGRENSPSAFNAVVILHALANQDGRREDAVRHSRHILTLTQHEYGPGHPEVAWAHAALGEALRDIGRPDEAATSFEAALQVYGDNPDPWKQRLRTKLALANLLWQDDRDRDRAEQLARDVAAEIPEGEAGDDVRTALEVWKDSPP